MGGQIYCSFCGKSQHEILKLIAGPSVFICDECVELCAEMVREARQAKTEKQEQSLPAPPEAG